MPDRHLRDSLNALLTSGVASTPVRDEVYDSWHRSLNSGLSPESFEVPFETDMAQDERAVQAAVPVLEEVARELADHSVAVVYSDPAGHVLARWAAQRRLESRLDQISLAPGFVYAEDRVGTNAIGTAAALRSPSFIDGEEHFLDALTDMCCAAAPVYDPQTGRLLGVVDLTSRLGEGNRLMLPIAIRAARDIETRLVDDGGIVDRLLLQRFLRARRGAKGPLVLLGSTRMITNAAADRLVADTDRAALWEIACQLVATGDTATIRLTLGATVTVRSEPVFDGADLVGVVLHLSDAVAVGQRRRARGGTSGWGSLTDSEWSVTTLAIQGLTNRQIAERLFLSPHTVDSHLRAVFRKVGVRSRTQLAHAASGRASPGR